MGNGFFYVRAIPEQEDHDQGVREPDLGAVDGAVAGAFDHGEDVMVARVEDDALDRGLFVPGVVSSQVSIFVSPGEVFFHLFFFLSLFLSVGDGKGGVGGGGGGGTKERGIHSRGPGETVSRFTLIHAYIPEHSVKTPPQPWLPLWFLIRFDLRASLSAVRASGMLLVDWYRQRKRERRKERAAKERFYEDTRGSVEGNRNGTLSRKKEEKNWILFSCASSSVSGWLFG